MRRSRVRFPEAAPTFTYGNAPVEDRGDRHAVPELLTLPPADERFGIG
jgi:hypothetical protein